MNRTLTYQTGRVTEGDQPIRTWRFLERMAGGESVDESQFKGLSKIFNSTTNRGRANSAMATYAVFGAIILYYVIKPKSKSK